jgi:CRP-like cAMP-binding protein
MKARPEVRVGLTSAQVAAVLTGLKPRFLEGLSEAEAKSVLAAATRRRFSAGSVMAQEGDRAEHLFLMLDGGARHYTMSPRGEKIGVRWIPPGDVIGGAAFLSIPTMYLLSTEAVKPSVALVWERAAIRSFVPALPRLLENALLVAHDYLILYKILHVAISCHSAPQRVAQVLGYLAKEMGHKVPGGVQIYVRNEELANDANVTIFTVSRLMGQWQRKGLLTKGRGNVVLRSPEELIRMEA